ncbi:hypothetical protein C8J56DRAFT_1133769 [Mycena floridula]|nr:hypothetical protein C8J56DRAFT_1133769 [Mycena floridula]
MITTVLLLHVPFKQFLTHLHNQQSFPPSTVIRAPTILNIVLLMIRLNPTSLSQTQSEVLTPAKPNTMTDFKANSILSFVHPIVWSRASSAAAGGKPLCQSNRQEALRKKNIGRESIEEEARRRDPTLRPSAKQKVLEGVLGTTERCSLLLDLRRKGERKWKTGRRRKENDETNEQNTPSTNSHQVSRVDERAASEPGALARAESAMDVETSLVVTEEPAVEPSSSTSGQKNE